MRETMQNQMVEIADKFCRVYGVTLQDLFQRNKHKGGKKKKVINGVNVSTIRMALGYYLSNNFPTTLTEVALLIGYKDHSTVSYNNQKIYFYLKNRDRYFMYYYDILADIGKEYLVRNYNIINHNQFHVN